MNAPVSQLNAPVVRGAATPSKGVVICLPAMGTRASYYAPLCDRFQEAGFDAVAVDHRGIGTSEVKVRRGTRFGYREMVHEDVPRVVAAVRERFPSRPVHLLGHSLGGHIASLAMAANPDLCDVLLLVASGSVYFSGYPFPNSVGVLVGSQVAAAVAAGLGMYPGDKLGFGGRQPRGVIRDWARQCRTGRYVLDGSDIDYEARLAAMSNPVLALSILGDAACPVEATGNLLKKMRAASVTHETLDVVAPGKPHFKWVKHSDAVVTRIAEFLA